MFIGILIGLAFYIFVLPVAEQIAAFVSGFIECQRMKLSVKAAELQKEIDELTSQNINGETQAIGFMYPSGEEEIEFDE